MANRRQIFQRMVLRGKQIGFNRMTFTGNVRSNTIDGTVHAKPPRPGGHDAADGSMDDAMDEVRVPWQARRTANPGYFAPTGTDIP